MKKLVAIALASALSSTAFATSETFTLDPNHTLPRFEYNHMGFSEQLSRFDKTTGTITMDPVAKTGSADITIDATSVDTGSTLFNGHIQEEPFLDTAHYPTITFKSNDFKFDGDQLVAVNGDLTIKGITKSVSLKVLTFKCMIHPMLKKEACGVTATTTIKRSDFNAGKYAPLVGDDVTISLPVEGFVQ